MLHFDSSHSILTRDSRVSRAPPHQTLPSFLILLYIRVSLVIYVISLDSHFSLSNQKTEFKSFHDFVAESVEIFENITTITDIEKFMSKIDDSNEIKLKQLAGFWPKNQASGLPGGF